MLDLVNRNVIILQCELHYVSWIVNAIVEKAAPLTDEVSHKFSDERGLAAANGPHQGNGGRPRKSSTGDFVENWNTRRLKRLNSMILRRPLQGLPCPEGTGPSSGSKGGL